MSRGEPTTIELEILDSAPVEIKLGHAFGNLLITTQQSVTVRFEGGRVLELWGDGRWEVWSPDERLAHGADAPGWLVDSEEQRKRLVRGSRVVG